MAKPSRGHIETIIWTAAITALVTVAVQRSVNKSAEVKDRVTHPARRIAPAGPNNFGGY